MYTAVSISFIRLMQCHFAHVLVQSLLCEAVFCIFCCDHCETVLSLVSGPTFCDKWYMSRHFTITVSAVVVILPLCFPRRIDFLKYARFVAQILNIMSSYCLNK